jgi:hypothetical protein
MRSRFITLGLAAVLVSALAAPAFGQADRIVRLEPVASAYLPSLRDVQVEPAATTGFNVEVPIRIAPGGGRQDTGVVFPDIQDELTGVGAPTPLANFEGLSDDDNAATIGGRVVPPDTDGAVGPNHYFQWINLIIGIYDKAGNLVLGPVPGNALFGPLGAPCATTNNGDPQVLYDQKNGRWVASQFAINQGVQCVAVSATSDPTGGYFIYAFTVGGNNDYPKQGLWLNDTRDVLTFTFRTFGGPGGSISLDFMAADYVPMLSGGATAAVIARTGPSPFLEGTLPADVDGTNYPASDGALFGRINDAGTAYDIFRLDPNFPAGVPTFSMVDSAAIGPIDRVLPFENCLGNECIPQPAPGELLSALTFFTMWRMPFRDYGTHDQILVAATVDVGGGVGAAYWADLRNASTGSTNFSLADEGVYSPVNFGPRLERFMGSIAADKNGNIGYGYSASSTVSMPSVRYSGRTPTDPAGTLRDEAVAQAGGGVQTASASRWGDYSNMSIDPTDDCTFWYTGEYYANTNSFDFKTRVTSFRFDDCGTGGAVPTITQTGGSCPGNVTIQGSGFAPNREMALVASGNTRGFIKGGPLCNAAIFEIGEPLRLPPVFVVADGNGDFSVSLATQAGSCLVEGIDLSATCLTTEVLSTD